MGSYKLWEKTGQPVILVRKSAKEVNAFYNMCRHRGAAIVREEYGQAKSLVCGYHGWNYNYDGDLIGKRDPQDFVDFDDSCRSLHKIKIELLGNLIFVNFDLEAISLKESLGPIYDEFKEFQLGSLRLVDQYSYDVKCNWKIAMEANLEVYHVQSIHPKTVHVGLDYKGNVNTFYPNGHGRMIAPSRSYPELPVYGSTSDSDPNATSYHPIPQSSKRLGIDPSDSDPRPEIETAGYIARTCTQSYNLMPNLVTPMSERGFPILMWWPKTINECSFDVMWIAPDWGEGERPPIWDSQIKAFNDVLDEDLQFGGWIQKAVDSYAFDGVPLSYQEARIYHWHQEADKIIGLNKIPQDLQTNQVMGDDWTYPNDMENRLKEYNSK